MVKTSSVRVLYLVPKLAGGPQTPAAAAGALSPVTARLLRDALSAHTPAAARLPGGVLYLEHVALCLLGAGRDSATGDVVTATLGSGVYEVRLRTAVYRIHASAGSTTTKTLEVV